MGRGLLVCMASVMVTLLGLAIAGFEATVHSLEHVSATGADGSVHATYSCEHASGAEAVQFTIHDGGTEPDRAWVHAICDGEKRTASVRLSDPTHNSPGTQILVWLTGEHGAPEADRIGNHARVTVGEQL
ncbi:hypothetical protein [Nocardia jejuensis]|uniref:hypothetical protein n=1 Tax=Nocardia jejuensis TaxID=328049 RepID=UPI0008296956|nr:hypothetical protein [Nocardia jejuensis]